MNNTTEVSITVDAPVAKVWDALINPALVKQYMVGTNVASDYQVGSSISWKGEMNGKPYEDSGKILAFEPNKKLSYTHASGTSTHTITVDLKTEASKTEVHLEESDTPTTDEQKMAKKFWGEALAGMKKIVEN